MTEFEFSFKSGERKGLTKIVFDPSWFKENASVYNHNLARFASQLVMTGYDLPSVSKNYSIEDSGVFRVFNALGFTDMSIFSETGDTEEDTFIASGKITVDDREYTLITGGFVGSHFGQWYNNFDSGTGEVHQGFESAMNFAYSKFMDYYNNLKVSKKDVKVLLLGHSRGGATANLLAARLIDENIVAETGNIYAFTFAAPSNTMSEKRRNAEYDGIFNIINDEDFVTRCMPTAWGYGRYGKTLVLPNATNCSDYEEILRKVIRSFAIFAPGRNYRPFKKSVKVLDDLFGEFTEKVQNVTEYYGKKFRTPADEMSIQQYFTNTVCTVTGEREGSQRKKDGTMLLLKTSLMRNKSDHLLCSISDFFIGYEGLKGATGGKISDQYFSYAHDNCAYCAYMMNTSAKQLIEKEA